MSQSSPQHLNALTLPLHGQRLIEASAGTGKTWTIAALYLRLLLGHGQAPGSAHQRPLSVDEILVVTFTEAATEELRDRVRNRIYEARKAFTEGQSEDSFISALLAETENHPEQVKTLQAAERQMDEAAIFTIHGFCQRMLKQHAFESGTLFTSDLLDDESELLADTVADFWRRNMYPLSEELSGLAAENWKGPEALQKELLPWLNQHELTFVQQGLPVSLADIDKLAGEIRHIKQQWLQNRELIEAELAKVLNKRSKPWTRLARMTDFAQGPSLIPDFEKNAWDIYSQETLARACNKNKEIPDLPVFSAIENMRQKPDIKEAFHALMLGLAIREVSQQLSTRRDELRKMSFDDLLLKLAGALRADAGEELAERIRSTFRVGLIDEFQDTDAVQYRIFSHIYPQHSIDNGLFLIGDPKQAIYAFRGADIFTYIQARRAITDHYTLPTNWRSSSQMIAAVNGLFALAENPFIQNDIPFIPVQPSPPADQRGLFIDGSPQPALSVWLQENDGNALAKGSYEQTMTEATAREINRLLTLAGDSACETSSDKGKRPLTPGDIAVLVRNTYQAKMVQAALAEQGIASVLLSDRSSVFNAQEAIDLGRILTACLEPTSERHLRAALATSLLALTASELDELNHNEILWEETIEEFTDYQRLWLTRGVLPMIRSLLSRRGIAETLLTDTLGERRLTDTLHLGELLATAAREKDTPHALLRWFHEQIQNPDNNAKDQQLQLESEQKLVRIVTIHKSKGLEYGVVFVPFAITWREADRALYHDPTQQVVADLLKREDYLLKADRERLAEDLRLLYVALTRAIHACYLGVAPVKQNLRGKSTSTDLHKTALGYLLNGANEISSDQLPGLLNKMTESCPAIALVDLPKDPERAYEPPKTESPALAATPFTGTVSDNWWLTSYSALSRFASHAHAKTENSTPDASSELPGMDTEDQATPAATVVIERPPFSSLHDFPRGANPGTFLHTIFENICFENPVPDEIGTMISEELMIHGFEPQWQPALSAMVNDTLYATLNDDGLQLSQLQAGHYKPELEFNLQLGLLNASALTRLIQSEDPLAKQAGALSFPDVQGLLKGFIDLTFQHDGRWYVLDWKSNWLGDTTQAYSRDAMAAAMTDHRYDLQYLIYTLALHRLLKIRLPDYDYDQHVGGVFYIFLRGIDVNSSERTGVYDYRPPRQLIEKLDLLFAGKEPAGC